MRERYSRADGGGFSRAPDHADLPVDAGRQHRHRDCARSQDVAARHLGKRIVIDNRPGAGGALGPQNMAAGAKPDGYTLSQIPLGVFACRIW
jgi:hypothetical protein